MTAIRKQRGPSDEDLDLVPKVLVVPPELELTGKALLNSMEVAAAAGKPTGNALKDSLSLAVESRMSNSARFSNASTTKWMIFCGPDTAPVNVGFLEGIEAPIAEFQGLSEGRFDQLSVSWRIVLDTGASLGEHRAGFMSDGQ